MHQEWLPNLWPPFLPHSRLIAERDEIYHFYLNCLLFSLYAAPFSYSKRHSNSTATENKTTGIVIAAISPLPSPFDLDSPVKAVLVVVDVGVRVAEAVDAIVVVLAGP
jgi:hypothetical protein